LQHLTVFHGKLGHTGLRGKPSLLRSAYYGRKMMIGVCIVTVTERFQGRNEYTLDRAVK